MFNPGNKGVSGTDEGTSTSRPKKLIEVNGIIPLRTAGASKKAADPKLDSSIERGKEEKEGKEKAQFLAAGTRTH